MQTSTVIVYASPSPTERINVFPSASQNCTDCSFKKQQLLTVTLCVGKQLPVPGCNGNQMLVASFELPKRRETTAAREWIRCHQTCRRCCPGSKTIQAGKGILLSDLSDVDVGTKDGTHTGPHNHVDMWKPSKRLASSPTFSESVRQKRCLQYAHWSSGLHIFLPGARGFYFIAYHTKGGNRR